MKSFHSFGKSVLLFLICVLACQNNASALDTLKLKLIPYPQEVISGDSPFSFRKNISIVIDKNAVAADRFSAEELALNLKRNFNIDASVTTQPSEGSIRLTRKGTEKRIGKEGYHLTVTSEGIQIKAIDAPGIFYATQTLLQLVESENAGYKIRGLKITDWPTIRERAVHYDTKHHQDKKEYVESFIRDLARYKINMLVWEWEDKLAYTSHPEIGAPGAFTIEEMQYFTQYAKRYHIQLVPLVQGLGHVSFILKWPQHAALREVASSNWEFCPLKEGTYKLLFDLWDEALKATPGSTYIHIGSDETYELGTCSACKSKAEEIGKSGIYLLFANKAAQHLKSSGRKVMVWEPPQGWEMSKSPAVNIQPAKDLVLTESYDYETGDFKYAKTSKSLGYKVFAYDPNPGIEHLFLPYFFKEDDGKIIAGSLEESLSFFQSIYKSNAYDGVITTSWDDSGLHNQAWMLRFVMSASFSWNGSAPSLNDFKDFFFHDYYGPMSTDLEELFQLLNEGAYYYMSTFERKVWHHGDVGKTHLPDLPRGDALEFDPFWNTRYKDMVAKSKAIEARMQRALSIIDGNLTQPLRHISDLEVFKTIVRLIQHTAQTYIDLSTVEAMLAQANRHHFESHAAAYEDLIKIAAQLEGILERRVLVIDELTLTWDKTRLPKGISTKEKQYFFQQDRARHFANRRPDMSYLFYDEEKLYIDKYLNDIRAYAAYYKKTFLENKN